METKQTNENIKLIKSLIDPMRSNPKFAKLILFSLSTIKSVISSNEKQSVEAFSQLLLTKSIFELLKMIYERNFENEEILTKLGELIFCLVKLKQQETKLNIKYEDSISKNEIFSYVLEFLGNLNENFIESYQIFIKVLQLLSDETDISKSKLNTDDTKENNLYSVFSVSLNLLSKLNNNETIILYLIETLKKLFLSETSFKINSEDQVLLVTEINKIVNNMESYQSNSVIRESFHLLKTIINTHSEARECYKKSKPISLLLKVLTLSSETDHSLSFYCMQLLASIIEKKDIELFLRFLKESNYIEASRKRKSTLKISLIDNMEVNEGEKEMTFDNKENCFNENKEREEMIFGIIKEFNIPLSNSNSNNKSEVDEKEDKQEGNFNDDNNENKKQDVIDNKDNNDAVSIKSKDSNNNLKESEKNNKKVNDIKISPELILFLRKSIAKVLIMIAKDSNFLKILGELNSIETLIELIQIELESIEVDDEGNYKEKEMKENNRDLLESILPNFLKLVFALLNDLENSSKNSKAKTVATSNTNNKVLIEKIGCCLLQALVLLKNNKTSIMEIIDILLSSKNQLLLESMSRNFLKNFKPVYLKNYEEQKVGLLIIKMISIKNSVLRYEGLSKNIENSKTFKRLDTKETNELANNNNIKSNIVNFDLLNEELKNSFKKIEEAYQEYCKTKKSSANAQYEEISELNNNENFLNIDSNKNNKNATHYQIQSNPQIESCVSSIKQALLNISYGMFFESSFPENFFHENNVFNKSFLLLLSSENKLEKFSADFEMIRIYNNFLILSITNTNFGIQEDKIKTYMNFLNYVLIEPGLNLFINCFILKQIDFYLLPENKGFYKSIINNPLLISFINSTMREYITELNDGFDLENKCSYILESEIESINKNVNLNNASNANIITNTNSTANNSSSLFKRMSSSNINFNNNFGLMKKASNYISNNNANNYNNNFINDEASTTNNNNNEIKIKERNLLEGEILEYLLKYITTLLKHHTPTSFSQYIRENGIVMVIELCGNKIFDFESSKSVVKLLQKFSSESLFKVASQYFKNYIYSSKLIASINGINFSKGINEKIYTEILIFFKNLYKNCDIVEAIEEKLIVEHLINELDQIYSFYMDTNNKVFEIILELLSSFSKEKRLKRQLINSSIFLKLSQILKSIFANNDNTIGTCEDFEFNEKVFDFLCLIFINFLKSREFAQMLYDTYYSVLELVKVISLKINFSENTLSKLITVFQYVIDLEKQNQIQKEINESDNSNPSDSTAKQDILISNSNKLISLTFLTELLNKIPLESSNLRVTINKCITILNSENNNNNNDSYTPKRRVTTSGVLSDLIFNTNSTSYAAINKLQTDQLETIIKDVPISFDSLCQNIIFLFESLLEQDINTNKETESEHISTSLTELTKILEIISILNNSSKHSKIIAKRLPLKETIQQVYDLGIIDKAIILLNNKDYHLKIVVDSCITMLIKLEEIDKEIFYKNDKVFDYFMNSYKKNFEDMALLSKISNIDNTIINDNNNIEGESSDTNQNNIDNEINKNNLESTLNSSLINKKLQISLNFIEKINVDISISQTKPSLYELLNINIFVFSEKEKLILEDFFSKIASFLYKLISNNSFKEKTSSGKEGKEGSNISAINSFFASVFGANVKAIAELIVSMFNKFKYNCFSKNSRISQDIFKIIEYLSVEELFVKELVNFGLLENINEFLSSCKNVQNDEILDQENVFHCLRMLEVFCTYKFFLIKVIEQSTIANLTSIIELCLMITIENKSKGEDNLSSQTDNNDVIKIKEDNDINNKVTTPVHRETVSKSRTSINIKLDNNLLSSDLANSQQKLDIVGLSILMALKIFINAARQERKFCTILGIYGVKETVFSLITHFSSCQQTKEYNVNAITREIILYCLEMVFLLISDEYNLMFFREPLNISTLIDFLKLNIKEKQITCLLLKIVNQLLHNYKPSKTTTKLEFNSSISNQKADKNNLNSTIGGNSSNNYSNTILSTEENVKDSQMTIKEALDAYKMIEIFNDLLDLYSTNYEITYQACELISQFLNINDEQVIKDFLVSIIVNNFERYSSKQEIIEMFLSSILIMLKQVRQLSKTSHSTSYDPSSIIYFISKIINSNEIKINDFLYISIFKIIKQISKYSNLATSIVNEMFIIVKIVENRPSLQNDEDIILLFSKLLKLVCQANSAESNCLSSRDNNNNSSIKIKKNLINVNTGGSLIDDKESVNSSFKTGKGSFLNTSNSESQRNYSNNILKIIDDPIKYLLFLLKQIIKSVNNSIKNVNNNSVSQPCFQLLDDYKNIIIFFSLQSCEEKYLELFCEYLLSLYSKATNTHIDLSNKDKIEKQDKDKEEVINPKQIQIKETTAYVSKMVTLILEIINFLSMHIEYIKNKMLEVKLNTLIEEYIEKSGKVVDPLLQYQAKGALISLKKKKQTTTTNTNASEVINSRATTMRMSTISIQDSSGFLFPTLKEEVKIFLKEERKVKIYTEKGEIKERIIMFNEGLDQIIAIKKDGTKFEIFDTMSIKEMDRCVRSCTTQAFSKSQGLFTKRVKSLRGQKTFNVECSKEDDCIKYVDHISILIQNFKSIGKEDNMSNYGQ